MRKEVRIINYQEYFVTTFLDDGRIIGQRYPMFIECKNGSVLVLEECL